MSAIFYMLMAIILIRICAIFIMGPMPQDAYYFFYAQHPSLSYFDHPPAIAWLIKASTTIFGKNIVAIKLGDSILSALTVLSVYLLARLFFLKNIAGKAVTLLLSTLMVSVLSLISTPDAPLLFFWTWTLYSLYRAIFEERRVYWLYSGVLMGLAFDSKYTAVFLPAGLILFLLISTKYRHRLFSPWPWLTIVIMVLVSAPVIIWNYENHFASFAFQGSKRLESVGSFELNPRFTLGLIGNQLALLIPVLFIFLLRGVYLSLKDWGQKRVFPEKKKFLLSFFLPIFLTFFLLSPIYWVKINWIMPAYISGIILIAASVKEKWIEYQVIFSFIIHLGLLAEILFYPFPIKSDDTWVGWRALWQRTEIYKQKYKADFVFSADSYKSSATLNLYSDSFVLGQNVIGEPALHFDYIGTNLSKLKGKCAIFIDSDPTFKNIARGEPNPAKLKPYFQSVNQLKPIIIFRNGKPVRKFLVYLCHLYNPFPLGKNPMSQIDRKHQLTFIKQKSTSYPYINLKK